MNEWNDETLVAIHANANNEWEVWELPARQVQTVSTRGRVFRSFEKAEAYIEEQFDAANILRVEADDILEEMEEREDLRRVVLDYLTPTDV